MKYYVNQKEIILRKNNYLTEGSDTSIYKISSTIYKINKFKINPNQIKILEKPKTINTTQILLPIDFIYNKEKEIVGTTSKYIEKNQNQFDISISKLYSNLLVIEKDLNILSENKISVHDIHINNIIVDTNLNIYIIDYGDFYNEKNSTIADKQNKKCFLLLLREIITNTDIFGRFEADAINYIYKMLLYYGPLDFIKKLSLEYDTIVNYQKALAKKLTR